VLELTGRARTSRGGLPGAVRVMTLSPSSQDIDTNTDTDCRYSGGSPRGLTDCSLVLETSYRVCRSVREEGFNR
jgi:hypothetical protein